MGLIDVGGVQLHVEEIGRGAPALVLHGGLGVDHRMCRGLDPLGDRLRLVYVDHRGNGRSASDDLSTTTMAGWAADAAGVARRVGGGEPVIVIGHSYGGFIAQELAIAHPDVVRALVLVATTPGQLGAGEDPAPAGPPLPREHASRLAEMPGTDDELARMMHELAPAYLHRAPAEELRSALEGTVFRVDAMRRGFEELARWSAVDRLAGIEVPVLLVAGRHDAFTAWPQSERLAARLPDAEVVIMEHSAHVPWLDEPAAFFDAVTGWLTRRGLA